MKIVQRKVNFTNLLLLKRIMMTTFCFLGKVVQDFPALFFFKFCNPIFMKAQIWDDYQTSAFYSNKDRDY